MVRKNVGQVLFLLSLMLLAGWAPAADGSKCPEFGMTEIYGEYVISEVEKYGGGLTTHDAAKSRIGQRVVIAEEVFEEVDRVAVKNPSYQIKCYVVPEEGEVPVERRSSFYGFGIHRDVINVLSVSDESTGETVREYEIVGDSLWEMQDGWLYMLRLYCGAE